VQLHLYRGTLEPLLPWTHGAQPCSHGGLRDSHDPGSEPWASARFVLARHQRHQDAKACPSPDVRAKTGKQQLAAAETVGLWTTVARCVPTRTLVPGAPSLQGVDTGLGKSRQSASEQGCAP
jgi:hypothetical protein